MNKVLLSMFLLFSVHFTFGQLDSVDFSAHFENNPTFTAGLDSLSQGGDILQVEVNLSDPAFVGAITVLVYDAATETPLAIVRRNRNELISGQYTNNGLLIFNVPFLDPQGQYKIVLEVQNFQMAYLSPVVKFIPSN